jgi:hypothetical protein
MAHESGRDKIGRLRGCRADRQTRVVGLERLEERVALSTTLGDLAMTGATALSPQVVSAQYAVTGAAVSGPMTLAIYRSASPTFVASADVLVGQTTLAGADLGLGTHQVSVTLAQALDIDPGMKYVLAVANPGGQAAESDTSNDVASFRTWIVGAVTHGLEFSSFGEFPSWVTTMTSSLRADGYDAAIPYDWSALSTVPAPSAIVQASLGLSSQIDQTIARLPVQPNDVVDVHLIGYSRGADVVSMAADLLDWNTTPLRGGYLKLTMLDPHPAHNGPVAYDSVSTGPIGQLVNRAYLAFQAGANDPAIVISPRVDKAEVFYQTALVQHALSPADRVLNNWGEVPVGGTNSSVVYYNLTQAVASHNAIPSFYQEVISPTLATDSAVPIPASPVPSQPTGGGPAFRSTAAGTQFEFNQLRFIGISPTDTIRLLGDFSRLDSSLARSQFGRARKQFRVLDQQLGNLTRKSVLGFGATSLQQLSQWAESLLVPPQANGAANSERR